MYYRQWDEERERERRHTLWDADLYELERAGRELDERLRAEIRDRRRGRLRQLLRLPRRRPLAPTAPAPSLK